MHRPIVVLVILLLLGYVQAIVAGQGEEKLRVYLNDLSTLQADFTQRLFNEDGELIETAQGRLYLAKPGRFYWQYQQPYQQRIMSDGQTLWIYDEDLQQVTIRDVEEGLQSTPAAILGGGSRLDEHYLVEEMGEIEGYDWVKLQSLETDSQYRDIRLGFDGTRLGIMILTDNLGQTTRIDFDGEQRNVRLVPSLFEFTPPPGVDVIDDRQH